MTAALRRAGSRSRPNLPLVLGALLVGLLTALALFAPWLAPHDPLHHYFMLADRNGDLRMAPFEPGEVPGFPLGTDLDGRDMVSRLMWALRPTLILAMLVACIRLVTGIFLGFIQGLGH